MKEKLPIKLNFPDMNSQPDFSSNFFTVNKNQNSPFTSAERTGYIQKYGTHALACTTIQKGMQYFDLKGVGYIAYMKYLGVVTVLSDPVCDRKYYQIILGAFLNKFPRAQFVQVSAETAKILWQHNFYSTQMGFEVIVYLKNWDTKGSKKNVIRTSVNKAKKAGIEIKETNYDSGTLNISDKWLNSRKCKKRNLRFLLHPIDNEYTEGSRRFYAYQDNKAIGFVFFNPLYENGKIIGYCPNVSRSDKDFKQGVWYAIMNYAIELFKKEGKEFINLGIAPFVVSEKVEPHELKILRFLADLLYKRGNNLYNFRGLTFSKKRFEGTEKKVYYCSGSKCPLFSIFVVFRISGIL